MFLFVHRFGRLPKYQGKMAKLRYQDEIHARRALRRARNRQRWAEMSPAERRRAVIVIVVAALAFLIIGLVSGGGHSGTSYTMCEQIMQQKIQAGSTALAGGAPDACHGLSAAQMAKAFAAAQAATP